MPPLPKRKYPKARQGKRRQHLHTTLGHVIACPRCHSPRLAHTACPTCGYYRGREAVAVKGRELNQ